MFKVLAWLLAKPFIADRLIKLAKRSPYFPIGEYMDRWWLMPRWMLTYDKNGNLFPKSWMPFSIRIHHIKLPDAGRDLHDHPANYRTFILKGYYSEFRKNKGWRWLYTGDTVSALATSYHRINKVSEGGVWTLFVFGRRRHHWGFWVVDGYSPLGRKIGWEKYEQYQEQKRLKLLQRAYEERITGEMFQKEIDHFLKHL